MLGNTNGNSVKQKQRARYLTLQRKKQIARRNAMVKQSKRLIRRSAALGRKISPEAGRLILKTGMLLKVRAMLMSPEKRRRFMIAQGIMLKLIKQISMGRIPNSIPRILKLVLTRSQLKLLLILITKKMAIMEEVARRERHAIGRARVLNARPDISIDTSDANELSDFIKGRLSTYKLKIEESRDKAKGRWAGLELDRFKANIEYSRNKARSLWVSRT
ncbi:MAG: hypothetical protein JJW01_00785 [Alphaproteobacteria bacterium]|nr:hypothetical protein [Rickettsiales bacterium]